MYARQTALRTMAALTFIFGWTVALIAGLRLDLPIPVTAVGAALLAAMPALLLLAWSWTGRRPSSLGAGSSPTLDSAGEMVSLTLARYEERFGTAARRLAPLFLDTSPDNGGTAPGLIDDYASTEPARMRERFLRWREAAGALPAQRATMPATLLPVLEIKYQELAAELAAIEQYAAALDAGSDEGAGAVQAGSQGGAPGLEDLDQQRQRAKEARDRAWALALADPGGGAAEARLLLDQAETAYQQALQLESSAADLAALLAALRQAEELASSAAAALEQSLGGGR